MSEKQHRAEKDHAHRPHHEEAASTDVADLSGAKGASAHQRKQAGAAEGGFDERYGGLAKPDVSGRIINLSVKGHLTQITIARGKKDGVQVGMEGYVKAGEGMLADFQIEQANDHSSIASVEATPDMLAEHNMVVVNPTSKPKSSEPQKDMKARVVNVAIDGDKTKIWIARGIKSGARAGMKGYLTAGGNKPYLHFEVEEEHSSWCIAHVHASVDEINAHSDVVLNPSSMGAAEKGNEPAAKTQHAAGAAAGAAKPTN